MKDVLQQLQNVAQVNADLLKLFVKEGSSGRETILFFECFLLNFSM